MGRLGALDARVIILGASRMGSSFVGGILVIAMEPYLRSDAVGGTTFGLSEELAIGILIGLAALVASLGQPLMGQLSDRLGRRKLFIVVGLAIIAAMNGLYLVASTFLAFFLLRLILGVGSMMSIPTALALANEYCTKDNRGVNMGVYNLLQGLGQGIGPVIAGVIIVAGPYTLPVVGTRSGHETAFLLAATGATISVLLVTIFVAESDISGYVGDYDRPSFGVRGTPFYRDPVYLAAYQALVFGIAVSLIVPIQSNINTHLGQQELLFSIQFVLLGAVVGIVGPLVGWMSDRTGRRPYLIAGAAILGPATLAQGLVTTSELMMVARIAAGAGAALALAPTIAMIGDVAQQGDSGTKMSLLTMLFALGTAVGPIVGGGFISIGYVAPFAAAAAMTVPLFLAFLFWLPETHPRLGHVENPT